ncbi:MAG TPA: M23 family metallopeptidase [Chitinophagaceae bacterium]
MKKQLRLMLLLIIVLLPAALMAQTDSIRLFCPLEDAEVVPPPKDAMHYDPPDLCVVLTSKPDTIVKAVANARVTNTEIDEDGKHGVVLFAKIKGKDYYFWYTGMNKAIVTRNTMVKAGQPIGFLTPGEKIEMLMFQFETPMDPSKYLECKTVLKPF